MKSVWLLHHVHEFEDGHEDVKLMIDERVLGQLDWLEGYVSLQPGEE